MTQKKFVFRQLNRYICTRRIQFLLQNIHVVSFSYNDYVICCSIGRGKDIFTVYFFAIFLFSAFTDRLGGYGYEHLISPFKTIEIWSNG